MKKNFFLLVILTMALVGCKDNAEVRSAIGTYSYKTSGVIVVDTLSSATFSEQGAMEIVSLKEKDSVLLTFNALLGDVYSTHASIKGDDIALNPFVRSITLTHGIGLTSEIVPVQISGKGHMYDGSVILTLQYTGISKDSLMLSATDVQLIAKKNK